MASQPDGSRWRSLSCVASIRGGRFDSTLLRTTLVLGQGDYLRSADSALHLTRPWTFWKLMFHYSFYW
ncbi:hypothetical protein KCP73_10120 [Salmonella enterica subsp. enterica]|nr:hypothetical protein KCP73_10120 [Salmonella enterica subsp. enterica]